MVKYYPAIIGLGSNLKDRKRNLFKAISELVLDGNIALSGISGIYETSPVNSRARNRFLNCALKIATSYTPEKLLTKLKAIEKKLGRKRAPRNSSRIIDLDILIYGKRIIRSRKLVVPHRGLSRRRFVLLPLIDLDPGLVVPGMDYTVKELYDKIGDKSQKIARYD